MLGEAYLRILHPEAAVEALETAYRLDPQNARLRGRIGRALVSTHEYHRAVDFYEAAIRDVMRVTAGSGPGSGSGGESGAVSAEAVSLSRDLAKLYVKLARPEAALRVLGKAMGSAGAGIGELSAAGPRGEAKGKGSSGAGGVDAMSLTALQQDVQVMLLMSEVHLGPAQSTSLAAQNKSGRGSSSSSSPSRAGTATGGAGSGGAGSPSKPGGVSAEAAAAGQLCLEKARELQSRVLHLMRTAPHVSSQVSARGAVVCSCELCAV